MEASIAWSRDRTVLDIAHASSDDEGMQSIGG
jgi:hypothetical protein